MSKPFDLDVALAVWRRLLEHRHALSAEDVEELEGHVRDVVEGLVAKGAAPEAAFRAAVARFGDPEEVEAEYGKIHWTKVRHQRRVGRELIVELLMLRNYVKTTVRMLRRHRAFAFINIGGLAVGMACCLLILLYVREELSYDRHHADHERVFRLAVDIQTPTANRVFANISPTQGPALLKDYPQVEAMVRLLRSDDRLVVRRDRRFYEDNFFHADPSVFDVFSLPLARGDARTALARPATVVLAADVADRYFGAEDPVGQTLSINDEPYEVTGVLEDRSVNSHVRFNFITSMAPLESQDWFQNWHMTVFYTYLKLRPGTDVAAFGREIEDFAVRYVGDQLREWNVRYRYFLQPVADIHLHSDLRFELEPPGNAAHIYLFSAVAALVLVIASLNYVNLTTAQSALRAKEVGVRKVVGSRRSQLVRQFLGESFVLAALALVLGIGLVWLSFPWFGDLTGYRLHAGRLLSPELLAGMAVLLLLAGGLAGAFPALVLSAMRPVEVLKGGFGGSRRGTLLRKVLVTSQFATSLVLIAGTLTAFHQLDFMKRQDLGFDREQVLVLPVQGNVYLGEVYEEVKAELRQHPAVHTATASSHVPGRGAHNYATSLVGVPDDKGQSMFYLMVDYDFIPTYRIEMVAGRAFDRAVSTDAEGAFLLNEAGLKAFGWRTAEEALGNEVQAGFGRTGRIVGVYSDFNYRSLHTAVEPLLLAVAPDRFGYVSLKLDAADVPSVVAHVERVWNTRFPGNPLEYFFLDEDFDRQYQADEKTILILLVFAALAIGIACLGLLGLAAFATRARTKEIGIRKAMGASVAGIVGLLVKDFTRLVLLAVAIGMPVAYLAASRWLEGFAYHVAPSWLLLAAAGGGAFLFALLTIGYQAVRAARANPVKALRYE